MVFTCVTTDTGRLAWFISNNNILYHSSELVSQIDYIANIFKVELVNVTGSVFMSTATAHNISLDTDGKNITCGDSEFISADAKIETIRISMNSCTNNVQKIWFVSFFHMQILLLPHHST